MKFYLAILLVLSGFPAFGEVVEFVSDGCAPCERMRPVIDHLNQSGWMIQQVNISRTPDARSSGRTPEVVVIDDETGEVVWRQEGVCSLGQMLMVLDTWTANSQQKQFRVYGPAGTDREYLQSVADAAERARVEVTKSWFGDDKDIRFPQTARITIKEFNTSHGGGATSFGYDQGRCVGPFTATLVGTRENIVADVVPHEVHHMVFAQRFGKPVPRWADEGSAMLDEVSPIQRELQHNILIDGLRANRAFAMAELFAIRDYPKDMQRTLMVYAQGFSVCDFLVEHGGRRYFAEFLKELMDSERAQESVTEFYPFNSLKELQDSWLEWVKRGSPRSPKAGSVNFRPVCQWNGCQWIQVQPQRPPVAQRPPSQPPVVPVPRQPAPIPNVVQSKPCQCDPTLSARIKVIEQKISAFEASIEAGQMAGKPGRDGKNGKDAEPIDLDALAAKLADKVGCKCKPHEPAPQPKDEQHVVVVADQNAPYWQRLIEIIETSKKTYHGIQTAPLPSFPVGQHPQAVVYKNSVPVRVVKGQYQVEALLSRLARGEPI